MYGVLKCYNVAKDTQRYLGLLRLDVTSNGSEKCYKKSFTMIFQMLLCDECEGL
jgi:hypothetical protein